MSDPQSDDLPIEWLAAYADGELTPRERTRVENWLVENPDARELLEGQELFGPGNAEFWQIVQPPSPPPVRWAQVRSAIATARAIQPRRTLARWLGAVGLLATAASLFFLIWTPNRPVPEPRGIVKSRPSAPSAAVDDVPYAMASDDEVEIISLPESAANLLVVGVHPLHGSTMALARFGEVEFLGVGSDVAGRFPEVPSDRNAEEIPMIWAPRDP